MARARQQSYVASSTTTHDRIIHNLRTPAYRTACSHAYLARLMAKSTMGVASSSASIDGGFWPLVSATRGLHGMQSRTQRVQGMSPGLKGVGERGVSR